MPRILSGRDCRDALLPALKERFGRISGSPASALAGSPADTSVALGAVAPTLSIIQVGHRDDSASYIRAKTSFAKKLGVETRHIKLDGSIGQQELISVIKRENDDEKVCGVLVQLPLPESLDRDSVIGAIKREKDVDGLIEGSPVMPATARGVKLLLDFYGISLAGKKVTVIGRSKLVGAPIAEMSRKEGADVTVCHRGTPDISKETLGADVIIVAAGKPGLVGRGHVRAGQVIVDVGINTVTGDVLEDEIAGKKLVGDVAFAETAEVIGKEGAITPVPGGVGPMTVFALFQNLADLCEPPRP